MLDESHWHAWRSGYQLGLDHGRRDAEADEDRRAIESCRVAASIVHRATDWPVLDERIVGATDAQLRAMAAERERRGIDRFRAVGGAA